MPGANLLTLLDDIATLLDDVLMMTKVAAQKTAGVLGDDLALNAQQVTGVHPDRELPVVWAVAKGSIINKLILVPAALLISAVVPWLVMPLLMLGGLFLCFEGVEKVAHKLLHKPAEDAAHHQALLAAVEDVQVDLVVFEREKIQGAVRTDFILSAEIIVIALSTVATASFGTRVAVLLLTSLLATVGIYGLVAGIVKLDDAGLHLSRKQGTAKALGEWLLKAAPVLMKGLSVVGTAAMFLVGGSILLHGIQPLHHLTDSLRSAVTTLPRVGGVVGPMVSMLLDGLVGILAGGLTVGIVWAGKRLLRRS
ncbi:MAG: DUF808 domain-containing protein [Myxococcales bacterium]|nr:DUF808 domain-containing protein [Myxococcales bacterium]